MLVFFDETFRDSLSYKGASLGVLSGIAIPEQELHRVATDVYQLKYKHMGAEFARDGEIKGKELMKNWVFKLEAKGGTSRNLALARDLLAYIEAKKLTVFGCVCFEKALREFKCADVRALDMTFRYVFERIDMFMKIKFPDRRAKLIFDDRDYGINRLNAMVITNFFQRHAVGLSLDSMIKTPFFAISQAQNIGLQLADFVTTIIGLRFASHPNAAPYFSVLKRCLFTYQSAETDTMISSLKVIRGSGSVKK
jgi:hypothetical protein